MPEPMQIHKFFLIAASTQNQCLCGAPEKRGKARGATSMS